LWFEVWTARGGRAFTMRLLQDVLAWLDKLAWLGMDDGELPAFYV
jgi:hypothetical protein